MPDVPHPETGGSTDTVIEDERWLAVGLAALADRAVAATQDWLGGQGEVVVMGCDDGRIATLNADFRGKPRATNVLSWPAEGPEPHAPGVRPPLPEGAEWGDIAIAFDTCTAEAAAQGKPLADHVTHLLVHAVLHLAGFDHQNDADAETMEDAERSILTALDIPDPYEPKE